MPTFAMIDTLAAGSAGSLSHRERVGVRGSGLSRVYNPLTPTLSPSGRGSRPSPRDVSGRNTNHRSIGEDTMTLRTLTLLGLVAGLTAQAGMALAADPFTVTSPAYKDGDV